MYFFPFSYAAVGAFAEAKISKPDQIRAMTQRKIVFPDTNVFLQCKAVNELPWGDVIEADEIELLIGAPVQDEIDRLKNDGNQRRARRARDTNSLFRQVLTSHNETLLVRESAPRVTLRFAPSLPPKRDLAETLDLSRADDRLIDEVMNFRRGDSSTQIMSDDTGMMLRCRRHAVPLIPVPESWLLPPEKDERDKQIGTLKTEVAGLRSLEASLNLSLAGEDGQSINAIADHMPLYSDLSGGEIATLVEEIQSRYPQAKDFGIQPPSQREPGELGKWRSVLEPMYSWSAPTQEQIDRYQKEYQEWIGKARKKFEQLCLLLNSTHRIRKLQISLSNTSSRPADEVLLELMVHGNVNLCAAVGDETPHPIKQVDKLLPQVMLSQPPTPPRGEYLFDAFARNARFGIFGEHGLAGLRDYMPDYSGIRPAFFKRDRHEFYRREEDDKPAPTASFSCEEFRHHRTPQLFNLWLIVPAQSEIGRTRLHLRASARNIETPVDLYVPVEIQCATRTTYEVATKWRVEK
jgi:hypothetical protein